MRSVRLRVRSTATLVLVATTLLWLSMASCGGTPTLEPAEAPIQEPTKAPTQEPAEAPTQEPTKAPTPEPAPGAFDVKIDTSLWAEPGTVVGPGSREFRVGVIVNPKGQSELVIEGQVVLKPVSTEDAASFLAKWEDSTVLDDGKLPPIPPMLAQYKRDIPEWSGYQLVGVAPDPDKVDMEAMAQYAGKLGLSGTYSVSSPQMLALFALLLEEAAQGRQVGPNLFQGPTDCPDQSSQEYAVDPGAPNPSSPNEGFWDAYSEPLLNDADIGLVQAWQLVQMYGVSEFSVPIAIIDRGFTNSADYPQFESTGWDLIDGDSNAAASERHHHGTVVMGFAAARMDNRFGGAGTGALVTLPIPLRTANDFFATAHAIRTATSWGAQVTNLSRGNPCRWACDVFGWASGKDAMYGAIDDAIEQGVVVVASAGNDETDLADILYLPAEGGWRRHPIAVGAINVSTKRAIQSADGFTWGSNYGWPVTIWAPGTGMPTSPRPGDGDHWDCTSQGTSLAAPYVAGVAALMKALWPDMYSWDVEAILQETANPSPDPRAPLGYINALEALRHTALERGAISPPPDELEPNDYDNPEVITAGDYCLNLREGDSEDAYYFFLQDYQSLEIAVDPMFDLGNVTGELSGTSGRFVLPFSGDLEPGSYWIELSGEPSRPNLYCLMLTDQGATSLAADRFEANDTLGTAAALTFPESEVGGTIGVEDLNFHVEDDPDCFKLSVPEVSLPHSLQISVEPSADGTEGLFVVSLYDDSGADLETVYGELSVDGVARLFPGGEVTFCVEEGMRRRNHYRMDISYRPTPLPLPPPGTSPDFSVPDWIAAMDDRYLFVFPPRIGDRIPGVRPFPSDPKMIQAMLEGKPPEALISEMLVVLWREPKDFLADFSFSIKDGAELNILMRDRKGEVVAVAAVAEEWKEGPYVGQMQRIEVTGLGPGVYAIELSAKLQRPLVYEVTTGPY